MAAEVATQSTVAASRPDLRTVLIALGAAAVTGILTPFGHADLPRSISAGADSSAPWAIVTFASVFFTRARGWLAAVLGASSFVLMDALFYVTVDLRGGYYPHHYIAFWLGIAVLIGPLVGLCASWLRSSRALLREIAVAAPSAIMIGEGAFILIRLPGQSTVYAIACVLAGAVLFTALAAKRLRRPDRIAISLAICAATSAGFYGVYSLVPLVLNKVVP